MTKPAAQCRYPFLLLHGLFGFSEHSIGPWKFSYFRQVVPFLEQAGNSVFTLAVHPVHTIEFRARQVRAFIEQHPLLSQTRINLIGHSMGGLDGRYLASRLDPEKRIASLSTLATPHHGSLLADLFMQIPVLKQILSSHLPAIPNLSEKECLAFNQSIMDRDDVLYQSFSAHCGFIRACPILWPFWLILKLARGANDGQVTEQSAHWGECLGSLPGDHFELIGLHLGANIFKPLDHLQAIAQITHSLAQKGL